MNLIDIEYQDLLCYILGNGVEKKDRTGTGTLSIFGWQIRHNMKDGFPLLTTKKMHWKSIVTELLWFLRGDTNIKYLVDNGCHIWDGDAYKNFIDKTKGLNLNLEINKDIIVVEGPVYNATPRLLTKEEFINKIKTDDEFAKKWGELGKIYGRQWRNWKGKLVDKSIEFNAHTAWVPEQIDQIANLISELKTNPDSRRLMVNAWNVGELDQMVLPPCHYGFQVYTRELSLNDRILEFAKRDLDPSEFRKGGNYGTVIPKEKTLEVLNKHNIPTRAISLMWNQRSVDTFLGLPFNIASYGLLLEIIAKEVNMVPDDLIGNLGDVHLYSNHIEQAKEQIGREPFELPRLMLPNMEGQGIFDYSPTDIEIWDYQSHPAIKAPLSN
jgi:thymidylate synthase